MAAIGKGEAMVQAQARVGVFGIGLAAYWPQFDGLKARIEGHLGHVEARIARWADVVPGGLVDTAQGGAALGERFAREDLDLLVCYAGTYATSTQVLPAVQRANVPVLLLNLQPVVALDYATTDTTLWLENCGVCPIPELAGVLLRGGVRFEVVTGALYDDEAVWTDIEQWCRAAAVARTIRRSRFGVLGHTYPGMIDMATDLAAVHGQLGAHVEILEMGDLQERVQRAHEAEISQLVTTARDRFVADGEISTDAMDEAARVAVGLERLVDDYALDGLAYYYRGSAGDVLERIAANMILGNTLLTARGIPAAGEGDLKTAIAMKIMHELGAGGSFSEFCAMDFRERFFLMGHDGPAHIGISDGKPTLKELRVFHGKSGGGLSVEMRAKTGPVTVLGLTQGIDGTFRLLAAEGESLPGPVLRIGNSNHRIRFTLDLPEFMSAWSALGPTHHVALGLGHRIREIAKVARLLDLQLDTVS
jgi:L-arabinose isomerase